MRKTVLLGLALATGLALNLNPAWAQIHLAGITEAKGPGALAGTSFKNGYQMAMDEINAAGGVLGQKLLLTQFDIDTAPEAAVDATQKALATKPFAILGPVFSGLTMASMAHTRGTVQFTGGEASSLTRQFHPTLLRTSLSQIGSAPRLAGLVSYGLNAHKVGLLWVDNEFGRNGHTEILGALKRRSTQITFDQPIPPGIKDYSKEVAALKAADMEAALIYATEAECIELLKELKKQGFNKQIVGDGPLASAKVLAAVGDAAEGVLVHLNTSVDAPVVQMQAFASRYAARFGSKPDQNSVKGYFSVQIIKAGLEMQGKVDASAFMNTVKNTRFDNKRFPELLSAVSYDLFGDLNRESYYAVIRAGQPRIIAAIRATEGGQVELPNGRSIPLNSNEFRRELAADMGGASAGAAPATGKTTK